MSVFDTLPGFDIPVGSISKGLAKMWGDYAVAGRPAPESDDAKATQLNLVLHLGFGATPADGAAQFQIAVNFSRRHPCRVVVLCPLPLDDTTGDYRAKIHGECHLGKTKGDTRCCEFVMLSYPMSARRFLENQVSICLSADLPLYYWAHRFASTTRLNDYQYLLRRSRRVILDSAAAPGGFLDFSWPHPGAVRDLAFARILPVRQTIGQYLGGIAPADIAGGLRAIRVQAAPRLAAEGRVLLDWARDRAAACARAARAAADGTAADGARADGTRTDGTGADGTGADGARPPDAPSIECTAQPAPEPDALALSFEYDAPARRSFRWHANIAKNSACFETHYNHNRATLEGTAALLSPEDALGEAMFF
ncbi:MAG: glucose-6-phosphate dehydrogenase assembly protein OpcA [Opitutaceae bacterium]|jgi:hypothetical protein|nr:glucose-6-phosphate dehydrogenase assembly protein OpcA [Opitutaceae bacterium]